MCISRYGRFVFRLGAIAAILLAPLTVFAGSVNIELTEPVLPIPAGKSANGNASYVWVGGGRVFDSAGNLGGTFPLGKIHRGQLYFHGDLFTWVQNSSIQHFQPKRIIYTIEPGYNWVKDNDEVRFFVKHQSYHNVDVKFGNTESYELVGFNYRKLSSPRYELRAAKYIERRVIDYDWDLSGGITFDLPREFGYKAYTHAWIHHVTESGNSFGRDGFSDYALEYGFTINDGLQLIARYEFLHDMDFFGGSSDHHFLVGPKYTW